MGDGGVSYVLRARHCETRNGVDDDGQQLVAGNFMAEGVLWMNWIHMGRARASMQSTSLLEIDGELFIEAVSLNEQLFLTAALAARNFLIALQTDPLLNTDFPGV